jgi:hypothetical protein
MAKDTFTRPQYIAGDPVEPKFNAADDDGKKPWSAVVNYVSGYGAQQAVEVRSESKELTRLAAGAVANALNKAMGA